MLMEIAVGVIIVIGILGFIGYSYMIKQQSDEVRKLYEDFKKTYGKTFSEYIWDFKLKKSQELLKHSNLKIHEISEKLGFESCAYFGKFFKKMTGMTPKEYRMKS